MAKPKEPRKCVNCGSEFIPRTFKSQTCGKLECQRTYQKEKYRRLPDEKIKRDFSSGEIWILDESTWH